MNVKNITSLLILMILPLSAHLSFAQTDLEGSKDHPLISRYPGSVIYRYDAKEFDEYVLPLGKLQGQDFQKSRKVEGKTTRIAYTTPEGRSIFEVYHNYEMALKNAGFKILYSGKGENELGDGFDMIYDMGGGDRDQYRFLSAQLSRPEGDVYVALFVTGGNGGQSQNELDIIETKPMETGLVTINAEALANDIAKSGHVAIYGIYFDTGKSDVKPESDQTLKEIARLLEKNPGLKLYVVGHTDNVGELAYNMKLSQDRADAVVKVLVSTHRVDPNQLKAYGVGPLSPVASNETDDGRAKNRRVELVKQ